MFHHSSLLKKVFRLSAAFGYGCLGHFLLLRTIALWGYTGSSERSFIDAPTLNLGFPVVGGVLTVIATNYLHPFAHQRPLKTSAFFFRAAICGFFAMNLALQFFFLLFAVKLAWEAVSANGGSFETAFVLAMLDIEVYGLVVIAVSAPLALLFGITLGFLLLWSKPQNASGASDLGR